VGAGRLAEARGLRNGWPASRQATIVISSVKPPAFAEARNYSYGVVADSLVGVWSGDEARTRDILLGRKFVMPAVGIVPSAETMPRRDRLRPAKAACSGLKLR